MNQFNGYRKIVIVYNLTGLRNEIIIDKLDVEQYLIYKSRSIKNKPIDMISLEKYDHLTNNWILSEVIYLNNELNALYLQSIIMKNHCDKCIDKQMMEIGRLVSPNYVTIFDQPNEITYCEFKIPSYCKCK